jgi:hypothetical protein
VALGGQDPGHARAETGAGTGDEDVPAHVSQSFFVMATDARFIIA